MSARIFDLKWAQTLDGQLCDDSGGSQWITGDAELRRTHDLRRSYDGVVVGASTLLKDRCQLTVRHVPLGEGQRQPVRIVVDGRGRLADTLDAGDGALAALLSAGSRPTIVLSPRRPKAGHPPNCRFIEVSLDFEGDAFAQTLAQGLNAAAVELGRPLDRLMVEGGPRLLTAFLRHGLYAQIFVSIAPILTGGRENRIFLGRNLPSKAKFRIDRADRLEADWMFTLQSESI